MKAERKKRTIRLAIWTWTWVATLAVATFGYKFIWENSLWTTMMNLNVKFTLNQWV